MLAKRIIPCLDVKEGRVVKGTRFLQLRDAGDPVELAALYDKAGADEVVFLDISASREGRGTLVDMVQRTAEQVFIPFTVGGGIRHVDDMREILRAGADKVSINTSAVNEPELIAAGAEQFGSQCIVVAIDARRVETKQQWQVYTHGGSRPTDLDAVDWARQVEALGAGEILLTSMDADGTKDGYDVELTRAVAEAVSIPVIASGGAGKLDHFRAVIEEGQADAVLAASLFHYRELTVRELKEYLAGCGIPVRLPAVAGLKFNQAGLIPAIVQDTAGTVLMLAYMNEEALRRTLDSGSTWFYSRSRQQLWHKGETSGHTQKVLAVAADCDYDTLLVTVEQTGEACHEPGHYSCFHNPLSESAWPTKTTDTGDTDGRC